MQKLSEEKVAVIEATMAMVANRGWSGLGLQEVADSAAMPYGEVCRLFPSKNALLFGFAQLIDQRVAEAISIDADEPARGRLFEVLMERFEILTPYRAALAALTYEARVGDVTLAGTLWRVSAASMRQALVLAQIEPAPMVKEVKVQALVALYGRVFKTFLRDDSEDLGETMRALDQQMGEAERWANGLNHMFDGHPSPMDTWFRRARSAARSAARAAARSAKKASKRASQRAGGGSRGHWEEQSGEQSDGRERGQGPSPSGNPGGGHRFRSQSPQDDPKHQGDIIEGEAQDISPQR